MNNQLCREARSYGFEVDTEAARLCRRGVAPWDALQQAHKIVEQRRREKAMREVDAVGELQFIERMSEVE